MNISGEENGEFRASVNADGDGLLQKSVVEWEAMQEKVEFQPQMQRDLQRVRSRAATRDS